MYYCYFVSPFLWLSNLLYSPFLIKRYPATIGFKLTAPWILRVGDIGRKKSKTMTLVFPSGLKHVTWGSLHSPSLQVWAADAEEAGSQAKHNPDVEFPRGKTDLRAARAGCPGPLPLTTSGTASRGWAFFEAESPDIHDVLLNGEKWLRSKHGVSRFIRDVEELRCACVCMCVGNVLEGDV